MIACIKKLVEAGNYGVKTGKGFYNYSPKSPDEVLQDINGKLLDMLQA
jgi:3-hydroxyacyl-CoA dehydrogenase